jgi:hypothetical protein
MALLASGERGRGEGDAKLAGLNSAFASKIAYFVCCSSNGAGPLIVDENAAWAAWALADIWDSRKGANNYDRYVRWAHDRAAELRCRPDDVERALFVLGPDARQIWDRLRP